MNVIYDVNGSQVTSIKEYDVDTSTVISIGQVVKLSAGKVVLAVAGETTPILGIAYENHSGAADTLNPRSNGTRIKVMDGPQSVYECTAPQVTATGGSTSTVAVSGLNGVFSDDDFNGGKIKLIAKGANSTITDPEGTVYPITDFTAATGTFTTTATITGGVTAGDIFAIFPPIGFQKGNLDSGISKLILTASAALPFMVSNMDTALNKVQFVAALHQFANKRA